MYFLKSMIKTVSVLKCFKPNGEITMQSDASGGGLGGCLPQSRQSIAFASGAFTSS